MYDHFLQGFIKAALDSTMNAGGQPHTLVNSAAKGMQAGVSFAAKGMQAKDQIKNPISSFRNEANSNFLQKNDQIQHNKVDVAETPAHYFNPYENTAVQALSRGAQSTFPQQAQPIQQLTSLISNMSQEQGEHLKSNLGQITPEQDQEIVSRLASGQLLNTDVPNLLSARQKLEETRDTPYIAKMLTPPQQGLHMTPSENKTVLEGLNILTPEQRAGISTDVEEAIGHSPQLHANLLNAGRVGTGLAARGVSSLATKVPALAQLGSKMPGLAAAATAGRTLGTGIGMGTGVLSAGALLYNLGHEAADAHPGALDEQLAGQATEFDGMRDPRYLQSVMQNMGRPFGSIVNAGRAGGSLIGALLEQADSENRVPGRELPPDVALSMY